MWETIIIQKVLPILAVAAAGLIVKFLGSLLAEQKKTAARKEAIDALEAGVALATRELVEKAKEAAKDGKLTKDEIDAARRIATHRAIEIATGPALTFILEAGWGTVTGIIDMLVGKKKKK